jgi:hypothetical protein
MTDDNSEVDLDVSGPTATAIAGSILSICEEASDPDDISVTLSFGESTLTLGGDGQDAVEVAPKMVSAVDWSEAGLDAISVHLTSTADDSTDFEPPEDPDDGDRVTAWESPDGPITPVEPGTARYEVLRCLATEGQSTAADVSEGVSKNRAAASSTLSKLYSGTGLLDRARVSKSGGGLRYVYRLNDHGRAVLDT